MTRAQQLRRKRDTFVSTEWMEKAACKSWPTDLFFPHRGDLGRPDARIPPECARVCALCPVRPECLEYAIVTHASGVWGGESEAGRKRIARKRRERGRVA